MSNQNSPNYCKHLSQEDRQEIQACLDQGMTFKDTARRIGKDPTTVSKEVKKHIQKKPLPDNCTQPDDICPHLLKVPYVCNPCKKRRYHCSFAKQFYFAPVAQKEYQTLLSEAREGIPLNKEEFYRNAAIIEDGIKRGQHLYHILKTNPMKVAPSTVYRHVKRGYLDVKPLDFPRMVKFKPRRNHYTPSIPKGLFVGRTFTDFQAYQEEYSVLYWVEMDTVIGTEGGKVILTMDFTYCNFMCGLLLDNKTALETASKFKALKTRLAEAEVSFGKVIPVLVCDRGMEFTDVFAFENGAEDRQETRLFFCDPMQASQKPHVEKNHTLFRDIVPKGSSFDHFTQDTVNLIFSHVNGVKRQSLHGKAPYEMFTFLYTVKLATLFGISYVPPEQVVQSPTLLKPR